MSLTVIQGGGKKVFEAAAGSTLLTALHEAGFPLLAPCGGRGVCGKCRVKAKGMLSPLTREEEKLFSGDEIGEGWRLSCMAKIEGDVSVFLEAGDGFSEIETRIGEQIRGDRAGRAAAFDIGTTTVASVLIDRESGAVLASDSGLNPQGEFGADVISRIEASLKGEGEALAGLIRRELSRQLDHLLRKSKTGAEALSEIVITGNTAMLYLLTGRDTDCLSHAPFEADELFGRTEPGFFLDAAPKTPVYLTRCASAFVGGDITTAVLASGMADKGETALLADIGTNGEIVLFKDGRLFCCSTAAGPALEGAGIEMGMSAVTGAITAVSIENGDFAVQTVGSAPDEGICGSGLIDAIAEMVGAGVIDETGLLLEEDHPFTGRVVEYRDDIAFRVGEKTVVTPKDIRAVQLAKAAIHSGIRTLLKKAELTPGQVERFYIAGGFGSKMNVENAAKMGLFPAQFPQKSVVLGNAALAGAVMAAQSGALREKSHELARQMETLELSTDPYFSDCYYEEILFGDGE